MRKRYKRITQFVSFQISQGQHTDLVLKPRIHLELLLTEAVNVHYQRSVLGVFDLAVALADLQGDRQTQDRFVAAQRVMYQLIYAGRSPGPQEADFLCQSFNQADHIFGRQSHTSFARALDAVDEIIADYETSNTTNTLTE